MSLGEPQFDRIQLSTPEELRVPRSITKLAKIGLAIMLIYAASRGNISEIFTTDNPVEDTAQTVEE